MEGACVVTRLSLNPSILEGRDPKIVMLRWSYVVVVWLLINGEFWWWILWMMMVEEEDS